MLVELIGFALVASFIAVVVLGHMLLASAIIRCAREDLAAGKWRARPPGAQPRRAISASSR